MKNTILQMKLRCNKKIPVKGWIIFLFVLLHSWSFAEKPMHQTPLNQELLKAILTGNTGGRSKYDTELVVNEKTRALEEKKIPPTDKVSELLRKGANPNTKYPNGTTALMLALEHNQEDAAKALLNAGADVNASGEHGMTALHIACKMTYTKSQIIELLLDKGAHIDVQTTDDLKITPLMFAVLTENESVVKVLLQRAANVHLQSETGETALDMAKKTNKKSLIDLFQSVGIK